MIDQTIIKIANSFIAEQTNGLSYELETVERVDGHPSLWTAIGRWKSSGNGIIDAAPIVVFVDEKTLEERFLGFEKDVLGNQGHLK